MERDHSRGSIRQLVASSYQETDEMNIGSQSTSIFIFSLELHLLEWYFPCLKQVFSLSSVKTVTDMLTFVSWGLLGLVKLTVNIYHNVIHCQLETQTYNFSFIFVYILMASTRETQFFWKKKRHLYEILPLQTSWYSVSCIFLPLTSAMFPDPLIQ